jgi:glutamate-ammonia-ligase adenylyltransferase
VFRPPSPLPPRPLDPARAVRLRREWAAETGATAADGRTEALLEGILDGSPFLGRLLAAHPEIWRRFLTDGADAAVADARADLLATGPGADVAGLMQQLRRAKARTALAVALADLSGAWTVDRVVASLSDFADLCVVRAVTALLLQAAAAGRLRTGDRDRCGYVVLGVGKLGAHELNYSSDIDLFVLFDPDRLPYAGRKSPQEFAVDLTKDLVRVLEERTADGYVFRTDLRLRPDPGSTSIAVAREAAQTYYESYGQNWERAALIKARFIAGDAEAAAAFLRDLQPFIWRKSLDFYALQDIHSIKRQIYAHKGGGTIQVGGHNVKLGRGGIREIEFFVQTQQLIWGGRLPATRIAPTLAALDALVAQGFVAGTVRDDLAAAYRFLRGLEHRLQMIGDEQTQTLPADPARLAQFAAFCGYATCAAFEADVESALRTVETHYAGLFEDAPSLAVDGNLVFTGTEDDPDTMATLRRLGFQNPSTVAAAVRAWHHGRYRATRSTRARQLLTEIMPALLAALGRTAQPDAALVRFDRCLGELPSGVQLLSVFQANPHLLDLVAEIMGDAPRLADHLARNPALLDYVLEPQFYSAVQDRDVLAADLETTLAAATSFEGVLDISRRWANDQRFRVGVQCLRGQVAPDVAAAHFADIAEAVLERLAPRVSAEFARNFGTVPGGAFALLAYGKLGSRELTPTSDLDLVLVYDAPADAASAGGPRSLSAPAYYIRFTQRLVTALTALTREGMLYDVDLRLRPDGDKGPLACSLDGFAKYQRENAWTWEHLALTRARVVHAPPALRARLESVMDEVLRRPRDGAALRRDVAAMRARMRKEHPGRDPWDLKHRPGGLIDAEFVIQYQHLRAGAGIPRRPGTVAMAEDLIAAGVIPPTTGESLVAGLLLWLRLQVMVRLTLAEETPKELPLGLQGKLARAAGAADFPALEALMAETAARISRLFQDAIGEEET